MIAIAAVCAAPFVLAALAIVGGMLVQQFHAPLDDASLTRSVEVEAGSAFWDIGDGCMKVASDRWKCDVVDASGSGAYLFEVTRRGNTSCWDAELLRDDGESPAPQQMSGCVNHFEGGWEGLILH